MELPRVDLIKYGNQRVQSAVVIGTTPAYELVHDTYVERGRFLAPELRMDRHAATRRLRRLAAGCCMRSTTRQ